MQVIRTVNTKRFSLNGIEYLKNYVTNVSGNQLEIFNCYDRCDTLLPPTHYNQFTVNGVAYNSAAQLQAALADVLYVRTTLGEVAADVSQDNVDLVRKYRIPTYTAANMLSAINTGSAFSIGDTQSVWFVFTTTTGTSSVPRGTVYKYKMTGLGKGDYGSANGTNTPIALTSANLELVYQSEPALRAVLLDPSTHVINLGIALPGSTISSLLNARPGSDAIDIQPAELGFTVFEATIGGVLTQQLWNGPSGRYGANASQATENEIATLPADETEANIPDYETVLKKANVTYESAVHKDKDQGYTTAYGTTIMHSAENGNCNLVFEPPLNDVQLTIPATMEDDTLALMSHINKPVKVISDTNGKITEGSYTLQAEDWKHWLLFESAENFTIKIEPYPIYKNTLIEGHISGPGSATFASESSLVITTPSDELPQTDQGNSVFGIKFLTEESALLFGKLKIN